MSPEFKAAIGAVIAQVLADENDGGLLSRTTHRRLGELRLALALEEQVEAAQVARLEEATRISTEAFLSLEPEVMRLRSLEEAAQALVSYSRRFGGLPLNSATRPLLAAVEAHLEGEAAK